MVPVVSVGQMQDLEKATITKIGIPSIVLMENAGRSVVDRMQVLAREGKIDLQTGQVLVLIGPGKNGADGMVIARCLHNRGISIRMVLCAEESHLMAESMIQWKAANACEVSMLLWKQSSQKVFAEIAQLRTKDVIIDALFGTGMTRPLSVELGSLIQAINQSSAFTIAVDVPSGLDADLGTPMLVTNSSQTAAVMADETVTFGFPKLGLCGSPGFSYTGHLTTVDIGIPKCLSKGLSVNTHLLDQNCLDPIIHTLNPLSHKGTHGHLLLIAGSKGKSGASLLAAMGALEVGVGLCTLASPSDVDSSWQGHFPEVMTISYPPNRGPAMEQVEEVTDILIEASHGKSACVIGPGIQPEILIGTVLWNLLEQGMVPLVLDADALNLIAHGPLTKLQSITKNRIVVLTPHPLEAARLLNQSVLQIQSNRLQSAKQLALQTGAIVVLKGPRTLVAMQDRRSQNVENVTISICPTGNAAMGTAGMGDILAGMIGALLARGIDAYQAVCAAVYWHGATGDFLAQKKVPGSLLRAKELCEGLHSCLEDILRKQHPGNKNES